MNKTKIDWADYSWNPIKGLCPEACWYCYARAMYRRFGLDKMREGKMNRNGLAWDPQSTIRWPRPPAKIFVCSTLELFHPKVPEGWRDAIFNIIRLRPELTFIILTKRPERIDRPMPDNVWLGVSIEGTEDMGRVFKLAEIKAKVRFVSLEPFMGTTPRFMFPAEFDWLIIGRLTGHGRKDDPELAALQWMVMHNKREFTDEECGVYNSILALIESSGDKESGGVEYKLRPEVAAFAALMEAELRKHDDRPGWKTCDLDWLMGRLREEVNELGLAVFSDGESIPQEAADVANFAMMIADVVGGLQKPAPSPGPSVSYAGRDLSGVKGTPTTVKEYTFIDRTSAAPLPEVEEAMATLRRFINEDELKYKAQAALAVVKAALSKQGPTSKDKIKCPHCQGSGDAAVYTGISETCETCKGTGEVDGPLEGQRLPCPGSKHQPSPPAEPTAGEPATRDIGKAEAVAYFDDLVSWMRKCPIPLPIDEEGIAAIRALILAPPVSVTREWVVETTREVIHLGNRLVDEEIPYFQRRLRERGIEVGEKL